MVRTVAPSSVSLLNSWRGCSRRNSPGEDQVTPIVLPFVEVVKPPGTGVYKNNKKMHSVFFWSG